MAKPKKSRQRQTPVREVLFDEEARREYLTGFHKRKLARQEAGRARDLEKRRLEHLQTRREHRRALAQRAAENAKKIEKAYGRTDSDSEWGGSEDMQPKPAEELEFEDGEKLATVTVVEDFDIGDINDSSPSHEHRPGGAQVPPRPRPAKSKNRWRVRAA
ncbi:hypothetical protein BOTBODRAFT_37436 [Botryobasidium botryosum FD-172 SS1]|uniref:Nucleolar protein 12 n=1 Tax=Botryobasidium botryosum (strain FD-172 SS1) TaxID=930990 RepID=A0A067M0I2_BOTB1|nr:hypothetical protein BOTBODRAFT_37436 [Botryobasidium botryosum FD-172 SS1]